MAGLIFYDAGSRRKAASVFGGEGPMYARVHGMKRCVGLFEKLKELFTELRRG
jgi:hypothetical protein